MKGQQEYTTSFYVMLALGVIRLIGFEPVATGD